MYITCWSFQGRSGEIKHLYRSLAFLHCRMYTENGGIFVCKTRHLQLAGGSKSSVSNASTLGGLGFMSPRIQSPMHPSGGRGARGGTRGGRGGFRVTRDRELLGKTIKICGGPYKGKNSTSLPIYFCEYYLIIYSQGLLAS